MSKLQVNIIFIIVLVIAVVISFYGFVFTAVSSIPFQDAQYAPASALETQRLEGILGIVMLVAGMIMTGGDIIWRIVMGKRIARKSEPK